jgi:hypothetical protein
LPTHSGFDSGFATGAGAGVGVGVGAGAGFSAGQAARPTVAAAMKDMDSWRMVAP